ncbi:hypothetical protein Ciccas_011862 [Cichlidogyrus casuarinus]|uniref:Secreted protein n=1 Tax=Cichlidogyrus casuarinus TaxID=1844966 RepID=A0ABD2PUY7_9PLAT
MLPSLNLAVMCLELIALQLSIAPHASLETRRKQPLAGDGIEYASSALLEPVESLIGTSDPTLVSC